MKKLICCLVVCTFFPLSALAGQSVLWFKSPSGDYIGQGREYFFTHGVDATITASPYGMAYSFNVNNQAYVPLQDARWWTLLMEAPKGQLLQVGAYENAMRSPFNDTTHPGISLYGDGRGCNQAAGRFEVIEVKRDTNGNLLQFAADFEQRCEITGPPLYGSIRYNSDIPVSAQIPPKIEISNVLNADKCVEASGPEGALVTLNGVSGQAGTLTWSTTTGLTGNGPVFTIPVSMGSTVGAMLSLTDSNGNVVTASKSICVSDTTPPSIRILSPEAGETFFGSNMQLAVEITDTVDRNIASYDVFVGNSLTGKLVDGLGKTVLSKPVNGDTITTEITVKAKDASGNNATKSVLVYQARNNTK